jgi:hypothetical protein
MPPPGCYALAGAADAAAAVRQELGVRLAMTGG